MKGQNKKCPYCGAMMEWSKLCDLWLCELCGYSETIEDLKTTEELDFE